MTEVAVTAVRLAGRLLVAATVAGGLVLVGDGLAKTVYFERTPQAVARASAGHTLILVACVVLGVAAVAAASLGPRWSAAAMAATILGFGGLALLAGRTFLPQLAAHPTFAAAVVGVAGVLLHLRR
jgi:hypothetical protein